LNNDLSLESSEHKGLKENEKLVYSLFAYFGTVLVTAYINVSPGMTAGSPFRLRAVWTGSDIVFF
jgi:hypothetical protein